MREHDLRAVIFIPLNVDARNWESHCLWQCEQQGYRLVATVNEANGGTWADADRMCHNGEADLIVVDRRPDLPPDRIPRVEEVGENLGEQVPTQRRPRPQSRRAGPPE
jgi:hypothetical protein